MAQMKRMTLSGYSGICDMASTEYCRGHRDCYECNHGREVFKRLAAFEDILFAADGTPRITLEELGELVNRGTAMTPARSTVLTGKLAEVAEKKGYTNYETYRCPVCETNVKERYLSGWRITDYCQRCGQKLVNVYDQAAEAAMDGRDGPND